MSNFYKKYEVDTHANVGTILSIFKDTISDRAVNGDIIQFGDFGLFCKEIVDYTGMEDYRIKIEVTNIDPLKSTYNISLTITNSDDKCLVNQEFSYVTIKQEFDPNVVVNEAGEFSEYAGYIYSIDDYLNVIRDIDYYIKKNKCKICIDNFIHYCKNRFFSKTDKSKCDYKITFKFTCQVPYIEKTYKFNDILDKGSLRIELFDKDDKSIMVTYINI